MAKSNTTEVFDEASIQLYLEKTQENKKGATSNRFLNQQINELYFKIEKGILDRKGNHDLLSDTIDRIRSNRYLTVDNEYDKVSFLGRPKKIEMCRFILDGKKCLHPKCPYAHHAYELDLVPHGRMIKGLKRSRSLRTAHADPKEFTNPPDKYKKEWIQVGSANPHEAAHTTFVISRLNRLTELHHAKENITIKEKKVKSYDPVKVAKKAEKKEAKRIKKEQKALKKSQKQLSFK